MFLTYMDSEVRLPCSSWGLGQASGNRPAQQSELQLQQPRPGMNLPEAPGLIPSNCHGAQDTASCARSPKSNTAGPGCGEGGAAQRCAC